MTAPSSSKSTGSSTIKEILQDKVFLFVCLVFILLALSYPPTFMIDSVHYMSLADVIRSNNWPEWDPIRGIVFPVFLHLFMAVLGRNPNALLVPMILAQIVLFIFSIFFVLHDMKIAKPAQRRLVILVVFLFLMLDPLILGYYHTVLTEFLAATVGIISCYGAYKLYQASETLPTISKPILLPYMYFLLAVPLAWHLKQPYVGTALFPFLLANLLILIRTFNQKVLLYVIAANLIVILSLGGSMFAWSGFLRAAGMPEKPDRELTGFITAAYDEKAGTVLSSPASAIKYVIKNYLALANIFYYDQTDDGILENNVVVSDVSFIRSAENGVIAYRAYDSYGLLGGNISPMPESFRAYLQEFSAGYFPPLWFNEVQKALTIKSNFMFSILYVLMPLVFVYSIFSLVKNRTPGSFFVFIASGSALLNILAHAVFVVLAIDRYAFWGYPLNMVSFIVLSIEWVRRAALARTTVPRTASQNFKP